MKTVDAATATQIAAEAQVQRLMVLFDLASGLYGFWQGNGPLSWNSITFNGGAQLLEFDFGQETLGNESNPFSVTLRTNPDAGLTADVLATFFAENYHLRPVTVYMAWFDPDTRAMAGNPVPFRRGLISDVGIYGDAGDRYLKGACESWSINHTRRGWAKSSDAEHRAIVSGDKFFEFTGTVGTVQMPFGTKLDSRYSPGGGGRPSL
jgi:hypothetical protein